MSETARPRAPMILYAVTIFLGAFLLFQVQPIAARILLPRFGGSAAVWTGCLLFFQLGLLCGYFHAWWTRRLLAPRTRRIVHVLLLGTSAALLPIVAPPASSQNRFGDTPALQLIALLTRTVGLPYVLLSSTGPLFQDLFVARHPGANPYRLFALSNFASLLALLSYPFLFEPHLGVAQQASWWSWAYGLFVLLAIAVTLDTHRSSADPPGSAVVPDNPESGTIHSDWVTPEWHTYALWVLLPACATTLLLAVTQHVTQDVAAIPLLWIVPLSLYLLSFILAFARRRFYRRFVFRPALALGLPLMAWLRFSQTRPPLATSISLWCAGLFIACMVLHGELSRLKPEPRSLTTYYLLISIGGALGGLFVGAIAPVLFSACVELEIGLIACATLALLAMLADARVRARFEERPWQAISAIAWVIALAVALAVGLGRGVEEARFAARNFYGALRVVDLGSPGDRNSVRKLLHGRINHGAQWLQRERAREPLTYYCADSGVALAFGNHHPDRVRSIGVIGLGAGCLAAYARAGDRIRYYEINPLVEHIARTQFTWLNDCPATVDTVLGDARLRLQDEPPNRFDILVVDAFSGDAIPVHLLTREAFALYFRHLNPDGVLAVHISNRHIDLEPVVADAAGPRAARVIAANDDDARYCFGSHWALIAGDRVLFANPAFADSEPPEARTDLRPWTDDYSNLVPLLR